MQQPSLRCVFLLMNHEALNGSRLAGTFVAVDHHSAQLHIAGSWFKSHRHVGKKFVHHNLFFHADHAVEGPVIPTSLIYAVPLGSTRSSAVGTCVCVPRTAVT